MRRLKRQSEGKSVALPRKPQVGWVLLIVLCTSFHFLLHLKYTSITSSSFFQILQNRLVFLNRVSS